MTDYSRIYVDTAPYIYYLEKNPQYAETVKRFFMDNYEAGTHFVTSTITFEEYNVIPFREKNIKQVHAFSKFLEDTDTEVVEITRSVAEKAAKIRAEYSNFKAMDALQLAAAVESDCNIFLTNDKQLKQFNELTVITVDEI